jgi:hypothetical protein
MVTLIDVLHKTGMDAYRNNNSCDFNVCITSDVEESESDFMSKYGLGSTYYFRLESYHHGRKLAAALYQRLLGQLKELPEYSISKTALHKKLYFFVHVKPQNQLIEMA